MKNSKLSTLLGKLQDLTSDVSNLGNDYNIETLNDDLSRNLKGGVAYANSNGSCGGSTNTSCSNANCSGSHNTSCANGTC